MPTLTVQIPDAEEVSYQFDEPQVTVGRNEDNHIVIPHSSLSGTHAQFVLNADGTYTLADNNSTNGTFVNGAQIVETVLGANAELLFGQVGAHFSHPELAAAPASPAATQAPAMEPLASTYQVGHLESTGRPANFVSISRFPKNLKKKDPVGTAMMAIGFFSLLIAVALVGASFVKL